MELTSSDLAAEDPENNFNLHAFNTLNKVAPPPETRTVRQVLDTAERLIGLRRP